MIRRKRAKWKSQRSNGRRFFVIKPAPVIKRITFDRFERGCLLIGIDPDDLIAGNLNAETLPDPPIHEAQKFVDLVVTRPELYRLSEWRTDLAILFTGIVAANFIVSSLASSERPRSIRRIFRAATG